MSGALPANTRMQTDNSGSNTRPLSKSSDLANNEVLFSGTSVALPLESREVFVWSNGLEPEIYGGMASR